MKKWLLALGICIMLGITGWTTDSFIDWKMLNPENATFKEVFITDIDDHEIYERGVIVFLCINSLALYHFISKKNDKKIKQNNEMIKSIFNNSPMGMYLWKLQGDDLILVDSNPAADKFTGIKNAELIGETLEKAFPSLANTELYEKYKLAASDGVPWHTSSYTYKDNNIDGVYDVWAFQLLQNLMVVTFVEITEQKKIQSELEHRNQELEQFAFAASHDLQEPLRVVSNYCDMLREKCSACANKDEDTIKWMTYTTDATARMQSLIKELLDYSRVGRKDKPFEVCSIREIIEDVKHDFEILIAETGAVIEIENDMPELSCIEFRIRQLFHNLISNAIKFRSKKKPIVNISVCEESDHYLFCCKDNGLGISPKYFDRIFGIFKRLYSRDEYPGTGIGLAMCKKIVETHNGTIWVDSHANKGASFYFTLPKN